MRVGDGERVISNKHYYNIIQYAPDKVFTADDEPVFSNKKVDSATIETLPDKPATEALPDNKSNDLNHDVESDDEATQIKIIKRTRRFRPAKKRLDSHMRRRDTA